MIGESEAGDGVTFSDISGMVVLPDSSIVVASWHSPPELYRFAASGMLINTMGGAGEAPGEFRSVSWVRASHDTLLVYDASLARLTRYSPDGRLLRTQQLPQSRFGRSSGSWWPLGVMASGEVLAQPMIRFAGGGAASGRSRMPLVSVDPGTGTPTQLALVPGTEYAPKPGTSRAMGVIFGKSTAIDYTEGRIFVTTGDELRTDEYDADGTLVRSYQSDAASRAVVEEDVEAYFDLVLGTVNPRDRQLAEQEVRALRRTAIIAEEFPSSGENDAVGVPAKAVVLDDDGRVWLAQYVGPRDVHAYWAVFESDGNYLGRVEVPARFWISHIRSDTVMGIYQNEDFVESVRAYRIRWEQP